MPGLALDVRRATGRRAIDSLLFLFGVISIAVIVWWEVRNDRTPPDGPTTGLLAMRPEAPAGRPDPRSGVSGQRRNRR